MGSSLARPTRPGSIGSDGDTGVKGKEVACLMCLGRWKTGPGRGPPGDGRASPILAKSGTERPRPQQIGDTAAAGCCTHLCR